MNSRIQELAIRAGIENHYVDLEKFAELIVRESITALKTNAEGYDNRAMFLMTELINRSETILLKHFGVKE